MIQYLILAKVIDRDLFTRYMKEGLIPTITQFGGKIVFRSTENKAVLGTDNWDAIAIQEWPNKEAFDAWLDSDTYKPWAIIRDQSAKLTIIQCQSTLSL